MELSCHAKPCDHRGHATPGPPCRLPPRRKLFLQARRRDDLPAIGQKAPEFTLPSQDGSPVSLKDFRGKWVVLYFYPKDNTPGCTSKPTTSSAIYPSSITSMPSSSRQPRFRRQPQGLLHQAGPHLQAARRYGQKSRRPIGSLRNLLVVKSPTATRSSSIRKAKSPKSGPASAPPAIARKSSPPSPASERARASA